jgi:hypothetical protein
MSKSSCIFIEQDKSERNAASSKARRWRFKLESLPLARGTRAVQLFTASIEYCMPLHIACIAALRVVK